MHSREQVTARIKTLWSEVLELEQLRCDVDFYAAGGSSLKALILLSELNQAFGVEFEIAEFVDCRTIETQSEAVWSRITGGTTARGGETVLVPLARASAGSAEDDRTFVAVHDVSGDIYGYASLARELSGRANLHGIKLAPERFDAPRDLSIPGLAAEYVAALESTFGRSHRLVIVGWSLGGMVGFEMAKLLGQGKHSVTRLVLLDTPYQLDLPSPDNAVDGIFSSKHERVILDELNASLGTGESLSEKEASVDDMWRAVRGRLDGPAKARLAAELQRRFPLMGRAIPHLSSLDAFELVRYVNRFRSVFHAGRGYRPSGTTKVAIDLLSASWSQNFDSRWSNVTSGIFQNRSLDGDHFSMLERKYIRGTTEAILNPLP